MSVFSFLMLISCSFLFFLKSPSTDHPLKKSKELSPLCHKNVDLDGILDPKSQLSHMGAVGNFRLAWLIPDTKDLLLIFVGVLIQLWLLVATKFQVLC